MSRYIFSWISISTQSYKKNLKRVLRFLIEKFAFKENLENIFKPIYQDYSREGRVIGFIIRIIRIILGAMLYFLSYLLFNIIYLIWFLMPIIFLFYLLDGIKGLIKIIN